MNRFAPTLLAALALVANAQNSATNQTMQRVAYYGQPMNITIETAPRPRVENVNDAVVRITKAALCGSDLHIVRGFFPNPQGGIGHEALGWVESVGAGVTNVEVGDYVVIPANLGDGHVEAAPTAGDAPSPLQAEYALVPNANQNLIPVPLTRNGTNATLERDYLLLGDVFPTAWQAVDWTGFQAGDTIAIWGAGPVGLIAALSAKIRGASKIYVIDRIEQRLERARTLGDNVVTIDFSTEDVVSTILADNEDGVMRLVDAVGFEATDSDLNFEPDLIWSEMLSVAHFQGGIGLAGIWLNVPEIDIDGVNLNPRAGEIPPNVTLDYSTLWQNEISVRGGTVVPQKDAGHLAELIRTGIARPSELIFTSDIHLDQVPEYYQRFSDWEEIKVYITFP